MAVRNLLSENGIVFDAKPDAVPYNYRISYKASQLCLILHKCSRRGCSLIKLHMISFALGSKNGMDKLRSFAESDNIANPVVLFDPAVNRAITFAIADGFIGQQKNGNYKLTDKGKDLVATIEQDEQLMVVEKQELSCLAKNLTEMKIDDLSETWRKTYAED